MTFFLVFKMSLFWESSNLECIIGFFSLLLFSKQIVDTKKLVMDFVCLILSRRISCRKKLNFSSLLLLFLELGQGKSYWNRLRFLDTCEFIIEIFSKSFFCKYFFLPAIELTHDPVANVRYGTSPRKYLKKLYF